MNKSVLITGSSRGIGKAIALQLAKDGFDIVLHCKNNIKLANLVLQDIQNIGINSRILQFDITNRKEVKKILEDDIDKNGAYYGIVLNAGITKDNAFPAMMEEDWDNVIHTNLDSFYNVLHPCIMPMVRTRKPGRIVCITSISGIIGNKGQVNYSASKAGIIGAAKSLAMELAKRNITVNCIAPGLIKTDMIDENIPIDEILKLIPAKRIGYPEDVAYAVSFFMSEKSSYITKQILSISGGLC